MTATPSVNLIDTSDPGALPRGSSRVWGIVGGLAVVLALLSALATFLVLAGMVPVPPTHQVVLWLFVLNALLILILLGLVAKESIGLFGRAVQE